MIIRMLATEAPYRFVGVEHVRSGAIHRRFRQRWNERGMIRASERNHRVTVNERGERRLGFVRRTRRRDEIYGVEMKALLRGLRHRYVPGVNRVEGAAEQSH